MIRLARPDDLEALVQLEAMFPSDRMSRRSLRQALSSPTCRLWVAEHEGGVVGSLLMFMRRSSHRARIYSVGIDPRARGKGYARALVNTAEHHASAQGRSIISLEVRQDNTAAQALYAGMGYIQQAELPAYYDDGASGLRFRKALKPDFPIGSAEKSR